MNEGIQTILLLWIALILTNIDINICAVNKENKKDLTDER